MTWASGEALCLPCSMHTTRAQSKLLFPELSCKDGRTLRGSAQAICPCPCPVLVLEPDRELPKWGTAPVSRAAPPHGAPLFVTS